MNFHVQTSKAVSNLLLWPSLTILLLLFKCLIGAQVAYNKFFLHFCFMIKQNFLFVLNIFLIYHKLINFVFAFLIFILIIILLRT